MDGLWWDLNNNGGFIVEEEEARLNCVGGVMQYHPHSKYLSICPAFIAGRVKQMRFIKEQRT